jgi:hypothetical protein
MTYASYAQKGADIIRAAIEAATAIAEGRCPCLNDCGRAHQTNTPCHCPELAEQRA